MNLKGFGCAMLARATRDLLLSEPTAQAAWDWLFQQPAAADAPITAEQCAWASETSLRRLQTSLRDKGYTQRPTAPVKIAAVLVAKKHKRHQPGWIKCQRCFQLAAVEDIRRASLCRDCGRRSPAWYAKKAARA